MPIELTMLAYAVALLIVLVFIQANAAVSSQGLIPLANNRDDVPPLTGFAARMKRTVDNHREGLIMFAPLAIIAVQTGRVSSLTALGAQLFFYARVGHAILYILGVPLIRPLFWVAGMVGTIMILLVILKVL